MTDNTQPDSGRSSAILLHGAKTARLYEELRSAIDGGHESMTHVDALAEISAIRAENETLRAGYAAAQLEIESLQARIKTMAEERADELTVAHLDGLMRTRSVAPAGEYPALPPDELRTNYLDLLQEVLDAKDVMLAAGCQQDSFGAMFAEYSASHGQAPAQTVPQQEPVGYLYCGGSYGDELADWEIVADQYQCDKLNEHHGAIGKEARLLLYTAPQPLPASQWDALLAATSTALEVLQKHRQMKGDWPMGELGRRAAEELQAARYVIFNSARAVDVGRRAVTSSTSSTLRLA